MCCDVDVCEECCKLFVLHPLYPFYPEHSVCEDCMNQNLEQDLHGPNCCCCVCELPTFSAEDSYSSVPSDYPGEPDQTEEPESPFCKDADWEHGPCPGCNLSVSDCDCRGNICPDCGRYNCIC